MKPFGVIKTKVETILGRSYGKPDFKTNIKNFKNHILGNKQISEAYYLYDELSTKKGLNESVVDDYISESFDQLKNIIDANKKKIEELSEWVDSLLSEDIGNHYVDIDHQIYTKNVVKNLEKLVESKVRIRKLLMSTEEKVVNESRDLNIPLSSMLNIATKTFNKEFSSLNEEEKKEFKYYTELTGEDLNNEMNKLKESVSNKLTLNLNESSDSELKEKIQKTINKINESEVSLRSLYKLKQLEKGLL